MANYDRPLLPDPPATKKGGLSAAPFPVFIDICSYGQLGNAGLNPTGFVR